MFVDAIEKVGQFTKPVLFISRKYGETKVDPSAGTLFFVNDQGCAVTCKQVAHMIISANQLNQKYTQFKEAKRNIGNVKNKKPLLHQLENEYGYHNGVMIEVKCQFVDCVKSLQEITCTIHPHYDLALIQFNDYQEICYSGHASLAADGEIARPGKMLCRLGYPLPEFDNYFYNNFADQIEWGKEGHAATPRFPLEGMMTRHMADEQGMYGIELSTPGFVGQNGGPLFDETGRVLGMQIGTTLLPLGGTFRVKPDSDGNTPQLNAPPQLYVGNCLHVNIIKDFLKEKNVEFFTA